MRVFTALFGWLGSKRLRPKDQKTNDYSWCKKWMLEGKKQEETKNELNQLNYLVADKSINIVKMTHKGIYDCKIRSFKEEVIMVEETGMRLAIIRQIDPQIIIPNNRKLGKTVVW